MNLILEPLSFLISLGLLLLFFMAIFSPLEALGWWAGWSDKSVDIEHSALTAYLDHPGDITPSPAEYFVIYLTAIGGISAEDISGRERRFLAGLQDKLPGTVIIDDVFPFSVNNNPLNGERQLAWLWQKIHNSRLRGRGSLMAALIFVRNLLQVAVSGDQRYGPIYNVGVAHEIAQSLVRHGYPLGKAKPIIVMGWSGGGQIAIGVGRYLNQSLNAPVQVVSIGGVMADDPSIAYIDHLYHLQGSADKLPLLGKILYPGRWPFLRYTPWNKALREGKITVIDPGPMHHTGRNDYFDRRATLPNGQSYLDKTIEVIANSLTQASS